MTENHFGANIAPVYDETHAERFDPAVLDPTIDFLDALVGAGPALEFGIGTGRVALPLAARGHEVDGIELSPEMLEELKNKPGGVDLEVVTGDFATATTGRTYALVFLVFNTINNLLTQDQQVACFQNAADHLDPGGCFVLEVGVPNLRRLPPRENSVAFTAEPHHIGVDRFTDIANQRFESHHHYVTTDGALHHVAPFRYVWLSELDLMARLAGLEPVGRWEDWVRSLFTGDSEHHVSVWSKPGS